MTIKFEQLRYFVAAAEDGQMTRAARRLHLAQPALSRAIAQLETELGVALFERHARGVTPTLAGEMFLAKARVALRAADDAALTARSLARATRGMLEFGFYGSPPMIDAPHLFAAFAEAHPDAEIAFRGLSFPRQSLARWLDNVDVVLCHSPPSQVGIRVKPLWLEPRVVVAPATHPLACRDRLRVKDVLDETFIGFHPSVAPQWAGFWSLDDHRGGPPHRTTADRAVTLHAMAAVVASGRAITTVAAGQAASIARILPTVATIPLADADPAVLALMWPQENRNPLVEAMATIAERLATSLETEPTPRTAAAGRAAQR